MTNGEPSNAASQGRDGLLGRAHAAVATGPGHLAGTRPGARCEELVHRRGRALLPGMGTRPIALNRLAYPPPAVPHSPAIPHRFFTRRLLGRTRGEHRLERLPASQGAGADAGALQPRRRDPDRGRAGRLRAAEPLRHAALRRAVQGQGDLLLPTSGPPRFSTRSTP